MTGRSRAGRGVVLLQTLIFVALLAMVAAVVVRWAFARHVLAKKNLDGSTAKGVLEGVEARLVSCLDGRAIASCTALPAWAVTCVTEAKSNVHVTTIGVNRRCKDPAQISITFNEGGAAPPCKVVIKLLPDNLNTQVSSPVDPAILVNCP